MCNKIDSEYLVANFFMYNEERDECSFQELNNIKTDIESKKPEWYIDLSKDSISAMLDSYPNLFTLSEDGIRCLKSTSQKENEVKLIDDQVNSWLDGSIKNGLSEYFRSR